MNEKRVQPFGNATHFMLWLERNCCQCQKYSDDGSGCEIQDAIEMGALFSGEIDSEIARRMGYFEAKADIWECTEVVWTDEWREECMKDLPF